MGGPNGITFRAWILISPVSIIFTWVVLPEGYAPTANIWNGLLVGLLSHIVTGLVLLLGKFTVLRNVGHKPRPLTSLIVFAVAGAARGWSVAYLLEVFGVTERADYADRMLAGSLIVLIWFSVCAVMVDGERQYRASYAELLEQFERQTILRTEQATALKSYQEKLLAEIRATLSDALRSGKTASDIHESVEQLIRPLAHRLNSSTKFFQSAVKPPARRIQIAPVIQTAFNQTAYSPLWTILVAVLATAYSKLWQFGLTALIDSVVSALIIWTFFTLAKRWKLYGFWVLPVWFFTGLSASLVTAWFSGNLSLQGIPSVLYLSINVVVPAAIVASIGAFDRNTERNLTTLRELADRVSWEAASLEQRAWVEQQRLARFVHSELQGRLRAFALRLDISGRKPTDEDIEKLRQECEEAFPLETKQRNFEDFLQNNLALWEDVVSIQTNIASEVFAALAADTYASAAVEEIWKEAVVNAVKHGRAKHLVINASIERSFSDQLLLVLEFNDDGIGPSEPKRGMGLAQLEQLTISHSLIRNENQTQLKAILTIAPALVSQN
jgi:anti-sigma regulatory factor (Ser/Thr protein kinase)